MKNTKSRRPLYVEVQGSDGKIKVFENVLPTQGYVTLDRVLINDLENTRSTNEGN